MFLLFMLLIVHIFIEEIQDIHCHTMGFPCRAVGVEVDGVPVVIQGLLPIALFAVGISPEIIHFVRIGGISHRIFVKQPDGFCYISLIDKLSLIIFSCSISYRVPDY